MCISVVKQIEIKRKCMVGDSFEQKYRGANGAAMPTDEDDHDGHFFFNHPKRGGNNAAYARAASVTAV